MDEKPEPLTQEAILARLRGQTLRIPNLTAILRDWPPAETNPHHAAVVPLVDRAIDRISVTHPSIAKRKEDDLALLTASWYPHASRDVLEALALYAVWLVCWDDCVDAAEGELAGDFEQAEKWRGDTTMILKETLGAWSDGEEPQIEVGDVDAVNGVFRDFGERFRTKAPVAQQKRLFEEINFFLKSCAVEQQLRLSTHVPNIDFYMIVRHGTVAGGTLCSLVEYATQEALPAAVDGCQHREKLWNQVCILCICLNDLLSLKKEIVSGCVVNAVTALMSRQPDKDLGEVVSEVEEKMKEAVEEFERAAEGMMDLVEGDTVQEDVVKRYIDGCRAIVTGTLAFTLKSPRYKVAQYLREDGTLDVAL